MKKNIVDLINAVDCQTTPARNLPKVDMPEDLTVFYEHFGEVTFYPNSQYPFKILPPDEFQKSNLIVTGEDLNDPVTEDWYTIVKCEDQLISINLKKGLTFGYCYDSFWDIYGTTNDDTLIAKSFTQLIINIIKSKGKNLFWIKSHH